MSNNYQMSLAVQCLFFFLHLDFNVQLPVENLRNSCARDISLCCNIYLLSLVI